MISLLLTGNISATPDAYFDSLLLAQAWLLIARIHTTVLILITSGAVTKTSHDAFEVSHSGSWGFARACRIEDPGVHVASLDLACHQMQASTLGHGLELESASSTRANLIARLRQCDKLAEKTPYNEFFGVYVISGGLGGLGLRAAALLVACGAVQLLLSSRSGGISSSGREEIGRLHATPTVVTSDVSDTADVRLLLSSGGSPVSGVLHAAGVLRDKMIRSMTASDLEVSASKAIAAFHLSSTITCAPLNTFALFSSWVTIFGSFGNANYVTANTYLNCFAFKQRWSGMGGCALQLPPVSGMGMSASFFDSGSPQVQAVLQLNGMSLDEYVLYLGGSLSMTICGRLAVVQSPLPSQMSDLRRIAPNAFTPLLDESARIVPLQSNGGYRSEALSSLKCVETHVGEVDSIEPFGVVMDDCRLIAADLLVHCIGPQSTGLTIAVMSYPKGVRGVLIANRSLCRKVRSSRRSLEQYVAASALDWAVTIQRLHGGVELGKVAHAPSFREVVFESLKEKEASLFNSEQSRARHRRGSEIHEDNVAHMDARTTVVVEKSAPVNQELSAFAQQLSLLPVSQRHGHSVTVILNLVRQLSGSADAALSGDEPLLEMGIDSLAATELASQLRELTHADLPATLVFEQPTPRAIATHLIDDAFNARQTSAVPECVEHTPATPPFSDSRVGLSSSASRWPGGVSKLVELQAMLNAAGDAVQRVPLMRWVLDKEHVSRYGGFLSGVQQFDPLHFKLAPVEVQAMDPQQRMLLEFGYAALHNAGDRLASVNGRALGIFIGIEHVDWQLLQVLRTSRTALQNESPYAAAGVHNRTDYVAPRCD